eukprot:58697-Chlamydomonas_euryale.AAC.1
MEHVCCTLPSRVALPPNPPPILQLWTTFGCGDAHRGHYLNTPPFSTLDHGRPGSRRDDVSPRSFSSPLPPPLPRPPKGPTWVAARGHRVLRQLQDELQVAAQVVAKAAKRA